MMTMQGQTPTGRRGMPPGMYVMTLQEYPEADPQALADQDKKIKDRQGAKETTNEITINLKSYVNCKLTDSLADKADQPDHTLEALPAGVNIYGGVPFDVQGIVQLDGPSVQTGIKKWPSAVKDIAIGHSFKKLHLLQGAFNIVAPNGHIKFAQLILHYADGTQASLDLAGGAQALRCVDAKVPQEIGLLQPPQTELAWTGANPYLTENNPSASLHLYRTTFDNPKPGTKVTAIDYISTMYNPGPFMVGLTIE